MRSNSRKWFLGSVALICFGLLMVFPDAEETQVVGMPPPVPIADWISEPTLQPLAHLPHLDDSFSYPIQLGKTGPVQSLLVNPTQYPFLCATEKSQLGQPLIDNQQGYGVPVYQETFPGEKTDTILGYSKDCSVATRIDYFYKPIGEERFRPWTPNNADVDSIMLNGAKIPFIVRVERGTINRFIYAIAALKGPDDVPDKVDTRYWNRRLIYQFKGGVGIGRRQGKLSVDKLLRRRAAELTLGYAVATSTGNYTTNHYHIQLAEDTAQRVKRQFIARYGEPLYTVGVGGSGGGLQQYLIGQNNPAVIDAAIPQYSYPDMVTQTVYAMDCELMEYYFDVTAADNPKWRNWDHRGHIQGLNALSGSDNRYRYLHWLNQLVQGVRPRLPEGSSECVRGWRGLTPLVHNPHYTHFSRYFDKSVFHQVNWTYWDDLEGIYGRNDTGHARSTWDNVGVQYGLKALKNGHLTPEEFLHLNARIGGWKKPAAMKPEYLWMPFGKQLPLWFSLWSAHNMNLSPDNGKTPARRTEGNLQAMQAAYRSGQVFMGQIYIPIIDLRHYLDSDLDMHHSHASLSARIRMQKAMGHADNQVIWIAHKDHDPTPQAFAAIDQWLENIHRYPEQGIVGNRPANVVDTCFDNKGAIIAQGDGVWDGDWNGKPTGACAQIYPFYETSRTVAGDSLAGDLFKCHLQSVDEAIAKGVYGALDMAPYRARLQETFPTGVCDYSRGDVGRPTDLQLVGAP